MDKLAVYLLIFTLNFIWISALITYFTSKYFKYKLKMVPLIILYNLYHIH